MLEDDASAFDCWWPREDSAAIVFHGKQLLLHAVACNAGDSFERELYQTVPEVIMASTTAELVEVRGHAPAIPSVHIVIVSAHCG